MIMEGQKGKSQKYNFVLLVSLCLWVFAPAGSLSALNIERAKIPFLSGDYKTAITEGERILTLSGNAPGLDELYYILGVSYLKDGNFRLSNNSHPKYNTAHPGRGHYQKASGFFPPL